MKPHKHAAVIKAWADGATIEYRCTLSPTWGVIDEPAFQKDVEYRVKPEKVRVTTKMTEQEFYMALTCGVEYVANSALRHAIDAGQVVPKEAHEQAAQDRDIAVARAVLTEVHRFLTRRGIHQDIAISLAAIIATVKD